MFSLLTLLTVFDSFHSYFLSFLLILKNRAHEFHPRVLNKITKTQPSAETMNMSQNIDKRSRSPSAARGRKVPFEDTITDEMVRKFKEACFYRAPKIFHKIQRVHCDFSTRNNIACSYIKPDVVKFQLPFVCEHFTGGAMHPRRIYIAKHRSHHRQYISRLSRRVRRLMSALSRTPLTIHQANLIVQELGDYMHLSSYTLSYPVHLRGWLMKRHHASRLSPSKKNPISPEVFSKYYLEPFLDSFDAFNWHSHIAFAVDVCDQNYPLSEVIEWMNAVDRVKPTFDNPIEDQLEWQMNAPDFLKDIPRKTKQKRKFAKLSQEERQHQRNATIERNRARLEKLRSPYNEDAGARVYSQVGSDFEDASESLEELSAMRDEVAGIVNMSDADLQQLFDTMLQGEEELPDLEQQPDADEVPGLLAQLFGYLERAKQASKNSITGTAEWLADHIIPVQEFLGKLWNGISKIFTTATSVIDWLDTQEDVWYIPKLVVLFMIYIVGYAIDCSAIARLLAALYASFVFTGPVAWIPALLAVATQASDKRLYSHAGIPSEGLVNTAVSLLAAAMFGKLSMMADMGSRSGFMASVDVLSRGLNGMINIGEKFSLLFKKAVGLFGLEQFGFSPDLESAFPEDFERLVTDVQYFSQQHVVRGFNTSPSDCRRAEKMRKELLIQQAKYAKSPVLRGHLGTMSTFIHRVADMAALRDPAHTKIRTEPVCLFMVGDPAVGKSVAINLIAAAVLAKQGFIREGASASEVSKTISENLYVRNTDEEFWNGYHNQYIVAEDDALQQKDSEVNPNAHPGEFIKISNSFPYPLNMAELQDKGTTYFQSPLYIVSTNLNIIKPESITSHEAYLRRITLPFKVFVKPEKRGPNGRIIQDPSRPGYDFDAYHFFYHDFKTGVTDNLDVNKRYDPSKALTLRQVCDLVNQMLRKKKDESALLEEACTSFSRMFSQAGPSRALVGAEDLQIEISADAKIMIDNYIAAKTPEFAVLNGMACWHYDNPSDAFVDMQAYYRARVNNRKMCTIVFDPRDHMTRLMRIKAWMKETKARFTSWWQNIGWTKILKFLGYATTLASVSLISGQFVYNRFEKWRAPKAASPIHEQFDQQAQNHGIFRSAPERAHAFTQGEHHIPYRYDQPTPFSWFSPKARYAVFTDMGMSDSFYEARDLFTKEFAQTKEIEEFKPEDFENTTYGLTWVKPRAIKHLISSEALATYEHLLSIWNASPEELQSMSGKSRSRLRSSLFARKAPTPLLSHVGNKNADEVLLKVQRNQAVMWMAKMNNNMLFFAGRKFLFNYHAYRLFQLHSEQTPFVTMTFGSATQGTQVAFNEIKWTKVADNLSDVIIGEMPRHACPEFSKITHFFVKKEELERLPYKEAMMTIPGPNGFQVRTGRVKALVTEEVSDQLGAYKVFGVEIAVVSRKGDCGAPYILDSGDSRRIFAIHAAGNESLVKSVGSVVTQEMLGSGSQSGTSMILQGNVIDLGHLPPVFANTKSQIVPTAIFNKVVETEMAPAKLARFDEPEGPMAKAIAKQFGPVFHVDPLTLHYAKRSYMSMLNNCAPPEEMGVLSFRRATRGDEGSDYIRPINRMRSAGYPFVLHTKMKGKTMWFPEDWSENEHTRELQALVESQILKMEQGEVQQYIFLDTLKDETRPIAKVREGKTRVFAAAPMDFIIVFRMYFLTFLAHMMRNRIDNESAVGIRAQSEEWTLLYHRLVSHGPRVIAGDFSNYDGSLNPRILWAVFDVIKHFYAVHGATEAEQRVRECLWSNIVNSYHLCGDIFYQLNHSQPSGNPSTAILNSMYNSIACRYVFYRLYDPSTEFNHFVKMIAYGDDNVLNVSSNVPLYNQENMARIFAEIGMTYTDEDKTGALGDKDITQVSFLKRKFAYDKEMRFCYAPLALSSILECFNWTKKSDAELDIITQNAKAAYVELAMHQKEVFDYWGRKIAKAISEGYGHQVYPITSWNGYRMEIRSGFAIDNIAELDWA